MDRARQRAHAQLGALLRNTRLAAGLTQRQLAARLKCPAQRVGAIESGARRLYLVEFSGYARALGTEPSELITTIRQSLKLRGSK